MPNSGSSSICKLCEHPVVLVGRKKGLYLNRDFDLFHCSNCQFYFVGDPELDPAKVYNADYYAGKGADKSVNYVKEVEAASETVRNYEWKGIVDAVSQIRGDLNHIQWLDYGCGVGGLLHYLKRKHNVIADGFDYGSGVDKLRKENFKILSDTEFGANEAQYDVITAIEVLEHCNDPLSEIKTIASLLKPGGLFFYTTGNSAFAKGSILDWSYFVPEVHISLFQPKTMAYCFSVCGLEPHHYGFLPGYESIIRFRILKAFKVSRMSWLEKLIPWNTLGPFVDNRYGISAFPMATKRV